MRVSDIRLEVGDPDAVLEKARDAAVDAATAKAEQYAEAAGQTLGDVVSIREVGEPPSRDVWSPEPEPRRVVRRRRPGRVQAPDPGREGRPEGPDRGGLGVRIGAAGHRAIDSAAVARTDGRRLRDSTT